MACHRPAVVFGISYRGEMGRDIGPSDAGYMPSASGTMANASPPPPPLGKQHHNHHHHQQQEEYLFGTSADRHNLRGGEREENDNDPFGDTLGCREMMLQNRAPQDDSESLQQAYQGDGDAPTSRLPSSRWFTVDGLEGSDDRALPAPTIVTTDGDGETTTRRAEENAGLLVSSDGDSTVQRRVTKAAEGQGGAAELSEIGLKRNELVDSWLLDVRLETETAGTALRVSATALHL